MRPLAAVALITAALHVAAALATLAAAPAMPPTQNPEWAAAHLATWRVTWALWSASALGLLATLALVAPATSLGRLALAIAGAGLAVDLSSQSLLVFVLPASGANAALAAKAGWTGAAVVANGLYTLAVVAAAAASHLKSPTSRSFVAASGAVGVTGAAVSISAAADSPLQPVAGAALTFAILAWLLLVGVTRWHGS